MITTMPPAGEMQAAYLRSDASYDGLFFLGVRTTGIFCRPVCRAKTPRAENVEFFPTPADALRHGYRACKLCKPLDAIGATPPLVARLVELVDSSIQVMYVCSAWL